MRQPFLLTPAPSSPPAAAAGPFRAGFDGSFHVKLVRDDNSLPPHDFFDPSLSVNCVSLDAGAGADSDFCEAGPSLSLVGPGEYLVGFRVGVIW